MTSFVRRLAMTMIVTAVLVFGGLLAMDHVFEDAQAGGQHHTVYTIHYEESGGQVHWNRYIVTQPPQPPQPSQHHTVYTIHYEISGGQVHWNRYILR